MANCMYSKQSVLHGKTVVDNVIILEYMKKLPETPLKVYLFGLMQCQFPVLSAEDIGIALELEPEVLVNSFAYLSEMGLVSILSDKPLTVEFQTITAAPVLSASKAKYRELLSSLQTVLKTRVFSPTELSTVYDWVEVFGLSEGAVVELVRMCIEANGSRISIKYMDRVARTWADEGILSVDEALEFEEGYICAISGAKELKRRWRVPGNVTEDELNLYKKWRFAWGFSDEAIINACSEVTNATRPSFGYLDKVLQSLYDNGSVKLDELLAYKKNRAQTIELGREMFVRAGLKSAPKREQCDEIETWSQSWRMDRETLLFAAQCANGKRSPFGYMRTLVKSWKAADILLPADAKRSYEAFGRGSAAKKTVAALNYSQRNYTDEELMSLVSTGDDIDDT